MIDVVYRIKTAPGKGEQALKWAKKNLEYIKKAGLIAPAVFILQSRSGEMGEITWVDRFSSLAAYEETLKKGQADSGWTANIKELMDSDWFLGLPCQIYDVIEVVE